MWPQAAGRMRVRGEFKVSRAIDRSGTVFVLRLQLPNAFYFSLALSRWERDQQRVRRTALQGGLAKRG